MFFGHFLSPEFMIFGIFCSFWGHFCDFLIFLRILWIVLIFGSVSARNWNHFWSHFGVFDPFLTVLFFGVFLSARFSCFLWFWVARGSILVPILLHFWEPWPSEKSVKSVQLSSISEVWPLPDRVFLHALIAGAFWWRLFVDFCDVGLFWGSHFETFWPQFSQKMRLEKMMKKVCKMSDTSKIGWSPFVPLKEGKSDKRQQTADNGLEHALACLAARWRIWLANYVSDGLNKHV